MRAFALTICCACLFLACTGRLHALPKFASRVGARCQSCHVNPTGGGMRNIFGSTYGREELPIHTYTSLVDTGEDGKITASKEDVTNIDDYSTAITPNFSYGADFRSLYFYEMASKSSSLFQMQGDLYLDYRVNRQFIVYIDKGLYSGFQVFGLAKVLPLDGYLKVGQFVPAYGTKIDDHTMFIRGGPYFQTNPALSGYRQGLIFGERAEQTGIEAGFAPSIFSIQAGLFDGAPFSGLNATSATRYKSVALRGDATIQSERVNVIAGLSYYNDPNPDPSEKIMIYGGFGSVTVFRNVTLNGELDYLKSPVGGNSVTGLMTFTELNYRLADGVDLKLGYDFYDPDKDLKTGSSARITVGAELFIMSGVELRPLYRFNREQPVEINNDEFDLMFHVYI